MENLKTVKVMLVIVMGLFVTDGMARAKDKPNIPQAVISSLNKKYPNAEVKQWKVKDNRYVAKVNVDNHKCFAAFDQDGKWISTSSNIRWAWNLPKVINTAYRKTKYNTWNVYFAKKVEKPTGEYYQLLVDDSNLHIGQHPEPVYTIDNLLEFKANGTLTMVKDITADPVP